MYPNYPNSSYSQGPPQPSYGFNLDNLNNNYNNNNNYGNQSGSAPYPTSNNSGFPNPDYGFGGGGDGARLGGGYPSSNNGYPSVPSYPSSNNAYSDYPSQNAGGYPSQNAGGYPSQNAGGYPSQNAGGYPSQNAGGYPSQDAGGYPSQNAGGYPTSAPSNYGQAPPSNSANIFPNLISQGGGHANSSYGSTNAYGNYPNSGSGVNYSQASLGEPALRPTYGFNPADDATKLYKAMKGFGTDETTLIDILCKRTYSERMQIAMSFKTQYGKDLSKNVASELSGNFKKLMTSLLISPLELEAADLKKAIDGLGTDESDVIEIICTKSNEEIVDLKRTYTRMFNRNMESDVAHDTSGYFKRILVSLVSGYRSEAPPDHAKAVQQANELYQGGMRKLGTDEVTFNRIFAAESYPHLRLVFEEYYKKTGHDIEKAIKSEMSGDVERAFLAIVGVVRNPSSYFASRLYAAMKGAGTHDSDLIRILISRSEKDLQTIKVEFQRKYGKTLESFIKGDCSGDYKRALLCLVGDSNWK